MRLFLLFAIMVCFLFLIISFCLRVGFWEKIRGLGKSLSSQSFVCFFSKLLFLYFRFLLFLFLIDKIFSNTHETTSFISGPEGISIAKACRVI
mgnify:FL=1